MTNCVQILGFSEQSKFTKSYIKTLWCFNFVNTVFAQSAKYSLPTENNDYQANVDCTVTKTFIAPLCSQNSAYIQYPKYYNLQYCNR